MLNISFDFFLLCVCLGVTILVVVATDRLALPRAVYQEQRPVVPLRARCLDLTLRGAVIALVFAGFFCFSWRPIYATQATVSFFVIFTAISRAKYYFIREPLLFSDIALVFSLLKDKELYHAGWLGAAFWLVSLGYIFGGTALYFVFEPAILPMENRAIWIGAGLVTAIVPWLLLFFRPVNRFLHRRVFVDRLGDLNIIRNTARFGTFPCVVFYLILWLHVRRYAFMSKTPHKPMRVLRESLCHEASADLPIIVIWQSESFFDLRHYGVETLRLPGLDALRRRAAQYGRVTNIFEGGYTLRTEFSVLSGVAPEDTAVDASYPYLHAGRYKSVAWPGKFQNAGWRTVFIHPFKRRFFNRHKAMPKLGFETLITLEAFDHTPRPDNPYVSDLALTHRVLEEIRSRAEAAAGKRRNIDDAEQNGLFVFVGSMANHGPWKAGRCTGLTDPVEIYIELLHRADSALSALVAGLDALPNPVWLLFYGDHAPLLKEVADPFPDPRTDYVIAPLGGAKAGREQTMAAACEEAPWRLIERLLHHMTGGR